MTTPRGVVQEPGRPSEADDDTKKGEGAWTSRAFAESWREQARRPPS